MASGSAIYLTRTRAIAVQVAGSAKKPTLKAVDVHDFQPIESAGEEQRLPTHEEQLKLRGEELKEWLKKSKVSVGGSTTLCIDSNDILLRNMAIAFKERAKIDRVIAFQVEGEIPSTPIEDLAVAYTQLAVDDDGSDLLVVAGRKERIRDYLTILDESGHEAVSANATIGGALNLRAIRPELRDVDEPSVWIDFQGTHALFMLLEGDQIVGVRNMLLPRSVLSELSEARTQYRSTRFMTMDEVRKLDPSFAGKRTEQSAEDQPSEEQKGEKLSKADKKRLKAEAKARKLAEKDARAEAKAEAKASASEQDAGEADQHADQATAATDQTEARESRAAAVNPADGESADGDDDDDAPSSPTSMFAKPMGSLCSGLSGPVSDRARPPKPPRPDPEELKKFGTPNVKPLIKRTANPTSEESVVQPISIRSEIGSDKIDVDPERPATSDADAANAADTPEEGADEPIFPQDQALELDEADAPRRVSRGAPETTGIYVYKQGDLTAVELGRLLQLEIRRLLLASGFEKPVRQLFVSGAPKSLAGSLGPITSGLDIPKVHFIDLLEDVLPLDKAGQPKIDLPDDDLPELPAIVGVAMKDLGGDRSQIEFLAGDLSPTDPFDAIKTPVMVGAMSICAIAIFGLMAVLAESRDLMDKLYQLADRGEIEEKVQEAYEYSRNPEDAKKVNISISRDNPVKSVKDITAMMESDLEKIKAGGKGDEPPTFPADVIYASVLKALSEGMGDTTENRVRDIMLRNITISQRGASTDKTRGTVDIDVYIPEAKLTDVRASLEQLAIDNPVWDGKSDTPRRVELFQRVEASSDPGERINRGTRQLPNGGQERVWIVLVSFDCEMNEVQRIDRSSSGGSGRPSGKPGQ